MENNFNFNLKNLFYLNYLLFLFYTIIGVMCIKYVKCEDGYNEFLLQRLNLSESNLIQQSILQQQQEQKMYTIHYTANDLNLIETFVKRLKFYSGQWSKHGLQRVVRLNAACSRNYVSLRKSRVKADVPAEEAFKDPYTLIEQQIFRKFVALKSTQTNRYVCYNTRNGYFHLKSIDMLDKHCIFTFKMNENNQFKFGLGSDMSVYLSFNENGRLIDYYKQMRQYEHNSHHRHHNQNNNKNFQCLNYSNLFYVHTKLSDIAQDFFSNLTPHTSIAPIAPTFPSTTTTTKRTTTTTTTTTTPITTTTMTTTTIIRRLLAVAKRPAKIRKTMNEKTNPTNLELSQQQQQQQEYRRATKTTAAPRNRQNLELRKQNHQQQQRYDPIIYYQQTPRATKKPADTKYHTNNLINYKWSIRKL